MQNIIPENDMDGKNIELKFFNILKNMVVRGNNVQLLESGEMEDSIFYYRSAILRMIANNRSTLDINYSHILFTDDHLAELIFFSYYRVRLNLTI